MLLELSRQAKDGSDRKLIGESVAWRLAGPGAMADEGNSCWEQVR